MSNSVLSDLEIAQKAIPLPIQKIADKLQIQASDLNTYGNYISKLPLRLIEEDKVAASNLILVSAISPTPAGEGKTTTTVGLNEALNLIGKKSIAVLREPSLGPVFGMKGGATGGGYAQVIPMEDINLHFTGDFSAVEKAHNLLSALLDNAIQNKNFPLRIDARTVVWKRVMDMNDRALRKINIGLGGTPNGIPRESGFDITAASEVMAILCLSTSIEDLKIRLGNIYLGNTFDGQPVYAKDIHAVGGMAVLLKNAIQPNLVQTLEGNPAIIHGGPFANIAQGTNTILATKMGMSLADFVVTEAGFGFDLGGEKFLDIKCRVGNLKPKAIVIVATLRALKYHGGMPLEELKNPSTDYLEKGLGNLLQHLNNAKKYGIQPITALNHFYFDTEEEIKFLKSKLMEHGYPLAVCRHWAEGGKGATELAEKVVDICNQSNKSDFKYLYELNQDIENKIEIIAKEIYGANVVEFSTKAISDIKKIKKLGGNQFPICMAKTQYSFTDDPSKIVHQNDFTLHIREVEFASGAQFIIPICGEMMRMPGLPNHPASEQMDLTNDGVVIGLS